MVGAPKVGKTALLSRYKDLDFDPLYMPTSAGDFSVKDVKIDSTAISAQIWDLGGSGILGKSFLRGTNGVILVVDLTSKSSMKVLDNVYERVRFLVGFADDSFPCTLVATKLDLTDEGKAREVSLEDLKAWAKSRRANAASADDEIRVHEVCAKDGRNVVPMFESIIKQSVDRPGKIASGFSAAAAAATAGSSATGGRGNQESYSYAAGSGAASGVAGTPSPFHFADSRNSPKSPLDADGESYEGEDSDQAIAKVVIAGAVNVGKTFLLTRFVGDDKDHLDGQYEPTVGADLRIVDMPVRDRTLTLQIWDTSGNPKMINIGRSIYKDADCLILVYDITSRESFTSLDTFWDSYIAYAQPYEPDEFPVLLVGNKCDLNDRRAVPLEEVMDWCAIKRPRKPITYLESSASRSMGVSDIFVFVADAIYDYALAADSLTDDEEEDDGEDSSTEVPSDCTGEEGSYDTPAKGGKRASSPRLAANRATARTPGRDGLSPGDRGLAAGRGHETTPNAQKTCFCWEPFVGGSKN